MTQLEILRYAYYGALNAWACENDHLQANPTNEITKLREAKASAKFEEIRNLLMAEEAKEA